MPSPAHRNPNGRGLYVLLYTPISSGWVYRPLQAGTLFHVPLSVSPSCSLSSYPSVFRATSIHLHPPPLSVTVFRISLLLRGGAVCPNFSAHSVLLMVPVGVWWADVLFASNLRANIIFRFPLFQEIASSDFNWPPLGEVL